MNNTFKKSVAAGALALIVAAGVPTAYAQTSNPTPTTASLQAQIDELIALITKLQAQAGSTATQGSTYTFTRSLKMGDTGADVQKLQQFLNQSSDTRVSLSGAGSVGSETMYYGPATAGAVSKFQMKYRADILTPVGLVNPTGYFGPSTISKINSLSTVVTVPTTPNTPSTPTSPNTPDEEVVGTILQGNGDLRTFKIDSVSNSRIAEAASDAEVAEVTLEAKNGDLELSRLDIALVADASNAEKDPWDVFETASLWVNGKKVAEKAIDNRSDYLSRTQGTIRFSDLKLILEEDEEIEIIVAVSVQNGVKGAGTNSNWSLSVDRLRYFDAQNVATDDSTTGDLKDTESFSIVERGFGEELKFALGKNSPIEGTIVVENNRRTSNVVLLEYTIEALDNDIEIDRLYVNVQTGTASYNDVVSDIRLKMGGKTFKKDSVVSTGDYSSNSVLVAFDIDNDITIDEDDKEEVQVLVDLKSKSAYENGETIFAQVTSVQRDMTRAEGADDVKDFSGSVIGKEQTLISEGVFVPVSSVRFSTESQGSNATIGVFTTEFAVTAVEGSFFITDFASSTIASTTGGVKFTVDSSVGDPTTVSASLSATAKEDNNGVFTIREGETETFTLTVVIDAATAGNHRISVDELYFSTNTDGVTGSTAYTMKPIAKFKSPYKFINN